MKIAITTDTHTEVSKKTKEIHEAFLKALNEAMDQAGAKTLIHSGDWAMSDFKETITSMEQFRKALPDKNILAVLGNHDLWSSADVKLDACEIKKILSKAMKDLNITYLQEKDFAQDNLIITGFDGWYQDPNPPTKDKEKMSDITQDRMTFNYLSHEASLCFGEILSKDLSSFKTKILVTHMSPYSKTLHDLNFSANPRMFPHIDGLFDVMVVGHSHQAMDEVIGSTRIINVGSNYDQPAFKIFEF